MTDEMDVLKRNYLPEDLSPLMAETSIGGTVVVQARQNLDETTWLLHLADNHSFIEGVVGWVDLRSSNVAEQLAKFAPHPKLVGVRHVVHDEPDDQFMLRDDFLHGLRELKPFDLTYDLLLFPKHLPVAVKVVQQFPGQPFVLDHIAKPLIRDGTLEPWATHIRELANYDHVSCKVSGMVTEAAWRGWSQDDFLPYLDVVFDCFGSDRLLFGSDWPVCTLAGSYSEVVGIVLSYIGQLTDAEQAKIMGKNAAAFYGLADE